MAIKQFYLQAIPFHNEKITIKNHANKIDQFYEIAGENWVAKKLKAQSLIHQIDSILPRSSWSEQAWKFNNGIVDNDASIDVEGEIVMSFSFRCDLTQKDLIFLKQMLGVSKKLNLNLFTIDGDVSIPPYNNILELIKKSRNYQYLSDPVKFIQNLDRANGIVLPYEIMEEE